MKRRAADQPQGVAVDGIDGLLDEDDVGNGESLDEVQHVARDVTNRRSDLAQVAVALKSQDRVEL